jgi:hypothetical protein
MITVMVMLLKMRRKYWNGRHTHTAYLTCKRIQCNVFFFIRYTKAANRKNIKGAYQLGRFYRDGLHSAPRDYHLFVKYMKLCYERSLTITLGDQNNFRQLVTTALRCQHCSCSSNIVPFVAPSSNTDSTGESKRSSNLIPTSGKHTISSSSGVVEDPFLHFSNEKEWAALRAIHFEFGARLGLSLFFI